ncbi:exodeoxyribonuclease V alpha subunit [Natronospira proteinivora]|uniref:RecBCD enzyme subunit RecD n=1 Tax=Natronospira proteinivora TaxID=1807133 RepID=A0ABT1G9Q0_9GAMM|nr:exodeoxyribonuclease V subunit alpha [Natronospira proteinivora]MCP1727630.1 exodeoxyribonuclease V alpha subunit [Natronospira proteinivora]
MLNDHIALPLNTAISAILDDWTREGWLRSVDHAFTCLLNEESGEQNEIVLLLAALTSQQVGQGNICLDLQQAVSEPMVLWPEHWAVEPQEETLDTPPAWLRQRPIDELAAALAKSTVVSTPGQDEVDDSRPLVFSGNRLYLRRYWRHEQEVAEALEKRLVAEPTVAEGLPERLAGLFPQAQDQAPATGPDWQKVASALALHSPLTIITGGPGTGKTTTVVRLLGLLQARHLEGGEDRALRIRLAAPTGKAAARLSESIGGAVEALALDRSVKDAIPREATTLHRLLGSRRNSRFFRHDRHNPLHADVVVVDEASMIDLEMTAKLLDALPSDCRLILLGDKDQLASVEAGAVLGDLCRGAEAGDYRADTVAWIDSACGEDIRDFQADSDDQAPAIRQHTVMLRHSHRFSAESGIGGLAKAINEGDSDRSLDLLGEADRDVTQQTLKGPDDTVVESLALAGYRDYLSLMEDQRPQEHGDKAPLDEETRAWAKQVIHAFSRFQVLATVRQGSLGVNGLNERIARKLKSAELVKNHHGWYEGRPVMMTRNDYELGLMNGDVGICLKTRLEDEDEARLRVAFELPDGKIRLVLPSRLDGAESVYAMTVHKSQGSEFNRVLVVLPEQDNPILSRELLYTAVTRAREGVTIAATGHALIRAAVERQVTRRSGLRERLGL